MGLSTEQSLILLLIIVTVGAIVFLADVIIFIRWILYRWAMYKDEEERYRLASEVAARERDGLENVSEAQDLRWKPEPEYPFARTWSLIDPFLVFQVVFIGIQLLSLIALLPIMMTPKGLNASAIFSPAGIVIQVLCIILMNALLVVAVAFCVHRYGLKLPEIGLGKPAPYQIGLGVALGLVVFAIVSGADIGLGALLPKVLPKAVFDALDQFTKAVTAGGMFETINSVPLKFLFALAGAVAAPIGEEVFFRGLLYNSLKRRLNVPAAIVISGLMFALVHIGPFAILLIFPMGMFLAYVYEKTKSLWVTICIHATHNGLSFVVAMAVPHAGEAPKQPIKPVLPPSKPGVVWQAPPHLSRDTWPRRNGVSIHG